MCIRDRCANGDRFSDWFPKVTARRSMRRGREGGEYREDYARCKRLYDSPLFYMRRRLNGRDGRSYGVRNKEYRE